jgi:predicted nuclease with TOPRIM domain
VRKAAVLRSLLIVLAVVMGLAAFASAQGSTQPDQNSILTALLAEVRAMRAELAAAASSGIRTQLLIGRLQLQEQRMNGVSNELTEVRRALAGLEEGRGPMLAEVRRLEDTLRAGVSGDPEQRAAAQMLEQMQMQVDQVQRQEQQLRTQESELSAQLASEQGRWIDFNTRLDEIERSLTAR